MLLKMTTIFEKKIKKRRVIIVSEALGVAEA